MEGSMSGVRCWRAWLSRPRVEGKARDDDPKSASAVLELVESDLPPALKPCVLGALSSTKCKAASVRKAVGWLEQQTMRLVMSSRTRSMLYVAAGPRP